MAEWLGRMFFGVPSHGSDLTNSRRDFSSRNGVMSLAQAGHNKLCNGTSFSYPKTFFDNSASKRINYRSMSNLDA